MDIKAQMTANDHLITSLVNSVSGIAKFNSFKRLFASSKFVCIYLIVFFEYRIDFTLKIYLVITGKNKGYAKQNTELRNVIFKKKKI